MFLQHFSGYWCVQGLLILRNHVFSALCLHCIRWRSCLPSTRYCWQGCIKNQGAPYEGVVGKCVTCVCSRHLCLFLLLKDFFLKDGVRTFHDFLREGLIEYLDVNEENNALVRGSPIINEMAFVFRHNTSLEELIVDYCHLTGCLIWRRGYVWNNSCWNRAFHHLGCLCWPDSFSSSQPVSEKYLSGLCSLFILPCWCLGLLVAVIVGYNCLFPFFFFPGVVCYGEASYGQYRL